MSNGTSNNGTSKMEMRVTVSGEGDIVAARQAARQMAIALGFGSVDQSRIATAVSELVRNVVRYANGGRGEVLLHELPSTPRGVGIELVVADDGPGIADLDLALHPGYTTGPGLGMGLPGTRRLMDETTIDSSHGRGTTVTIRKWHR
ncbi:MAG: anti-sigma regulatory factor (Ser/Thr protein kinase) [Chloroflexi bacterium]|nr:anti-sigma regulatory factor (Ser/Thr protein kinase) [Chloroflexota bacterium]